MKPNTKINILGWCMVGWGMIGLLKGYIAVILILCGIGILLKKNIARIIMIYFSFFTICMAILGVIGFLVGALIPRIFSDSAIDAKAVVLGIGLLVLFIVVGLLFLFIYKLLRTEEIKAEFLSNNLVK